MLAASIRSLEHLLYCFELETELVTVPAKILELWASKNVPMPDKQFRYKSSGKPIPYEELDLEQPKRLTYNTSLHAKQLRNSPLIIVQRSPDPHKPD